MASSACKEHLHLSDSEETRVLFGTWGEVLGFERNRFSFLFKCVYKFSIVLVVFAVKIALKNLPLLSKGDE